MREQTEPPKAKDRHAPPACEKAFNRLMKRAEANLANPARLTRKQMRVLFQAGSPREMHICLKELERRGYIRTGAEEE